MSPNVQPPYGTKLNRSHPLSQGLVGCWLLNEGAGTLIKDSTGMNQGVLTNSTITGSTSGWVNTIKGKAVYFDGVDDYILIKNDTFIVPPLFSFGAWFTSPNTTYSYQNRLCGNGDSTGGLTGADIIITAGAANSIYVVRRAGANNGTRDMNLSAPNIAVGWHHVFYTYDGTTSKLYYDGVLIGSNGTSGFTSTLPFRIGRDGNGSDKFLGAINDVKMYNRPLTQTEVYKLYTSPYCMFNNKKSGL